MYVLHLTVGVAIYNENWTMPQLRQLVVSFRLWRLGFSSRVVCVGFVVERVALGWVFLQYFSCPLSVSFHQYPLLCYFIYITLIPYTVFLGL